MKIPCGRTMLGAWLAVAALCCAGAVQGRRLGRVDSPVADEDPDLPGSPDSELNSVALSRPSYIECQSSEECASDHCCVLSGERYSIPSCRPMQGAGGVCRPNGHMPFNTTVGYPDHAQVDLHVFWLFCPCASGLACQPESYSCQVGL